MQTITNNTPPLFYSFQTHFPSTISIVRKKQNKTRVKKKMKLLLLLGEKMRSAVSSKTYCIVTCGGAGAAVQAELGSAAQEEIDLMSAVITGAAAGRGSTGLN